MLLTWMGDEVRQPQGWPHGQQRVARKLQQEFGQGAARTPQERPGRARRPSERPQVTQEWAWAAIEPQKEPKLAVELQETSQAVAQPLEAKVSGVAKPPP